MRNALVGFANAIAARRKLLLVKVYVTAGRKAAVAQGLIRLKK
jgi:hypothetical protein